MEKLHKQKCNELRKELKDRDRDIEALQKRCDGFVFQLIESCQIQTDS